jgi:hypothetical protein
MEILIRQTDDRLLLESPMPIGRRVLFLLLALFPLIAPYELILRPCWQGYLNFFFLLSSAVSIGALALSAFLVWAGIAGLGTRMRFDRSRRTFSFEQEAPERKRRTEEFLLDSIADLKLETHDGSDGAPSYSLELVLRDGRILPLGSSRSKTEVAALRDRTAAFLGLQ